MQRNANYALVVPTSTLLVIGVVVFSVWLEAFKFDQDYDCYDIVVEGLVWAAAGFTDTWFRCDDESRGGQCQDDSSAESSSLRR